MALQPVEAPGPVCQQTAKSKKTNQVGVASGHAGGPPPPQQRGSNPANQSTKKHTLPCPAAVVKLGNCKLCCEARVRLL